MSQDYAIINTGTTATSNLLVGLVPVLQLCLYSSDVASSNIWLRKLQEGLYYTGTTN